MPPPPPPDRPEDRSPPRDTPKAGAEGKAGAPRPPDNGAQDDDGGAPHAQPLLALPGAVWALVAAIAGIELVLQAAALGLVDAPGAAGWRLALVRDYGLQGAQFDRLVQIRRFDPAEMLRLVTYGFLHTGWLHALFVVVLAAALGKFTAEETGRPWVALAVFLAGSVVGGAMWALILAPQHWLLGGYPGVFGLVGAFTFLLWSELGRKGANRGRAFALMGVLLALRLGFGLVAGFGHDWLADLAGFATGFLLTPLLVPEARRRLLARLRER